MHISKENYLIFCIEIIKIGYVLFLSVNNVLSVWNSFLLSSFPIPQVLFASLQVALQLWFMHIIPWFESLENWRCSIKTWYFMCFWSWLPAPSCQTASSFCRYGKWAGLTDDAKRQIMATLRDIHLCVKGDSLPPDSQHASRSNRKVDRKNNKICQTTLCWMEMKWFV